MFKASWFILCVCVSFLVDRESLADQSLLKQHCSKCHSGEEPKGDFNLHSLRKIPNKDNISLWETSLDYVKSGEMPPAKASKLSQTNRNKLVKFFENQLSLTENLIDVKTTKPRRLNNREFANSLRDVLLIEDIGTNYPLSNLVGDSLHNGFDTHGDTLGFSKFHLERYVEAVRKVVDATILSGEKPKRKRYVIKPATIYAAHKRQDIDRPERRGKPEGFDFLDPRQQGYFRDFKVAPHTGWYKITVRCTGKDRGLYDEKKTGVYDADPITMKVRLGDREKIFNLPDEEVLELKLEEWISEGSQLKFINPTDGLRLRSNGNFKFQNAIAGEYIKEHQPAFYKELEESLAARKLANPDRKVQKITSWHHWVKYWSGPRPRILGAEVEGPFYKTWPSERQIALIGRNPKTEKAEVILKPIAERAWRRAIKPGELDSIVKLVQSKEQELGAIEAFKEGIVAILVSPQFLLLHQENLSPEEKFASKLSYFLSSTLPNQDLLQSAEKGGLANSEDVRKIVHQHFKNSQADPFLRSFPYAWLKLNDINFMAPDPDQYKIYHRKKISEDMINEALAFFEHAIENNLPITEFLSADYSFVNADLGIVYQLEDIPQDSILKKYHFKDGRRGGLLGMGAFLTVTADSLTTSPIHRAIYVMENYLGIHPTPPPADIVIQEPDVRSAKTIKEVLEAHRSDKTCASCHQSIDPYGYAFENFDSMGAWRDVYTPQESLDIEANQAKHKRIAKPANIPIDASATFRNGDSYNDIVQFRKLMLTKANQERFVRCFITKLLTYANGEEPKNYVEIEKIMKKSADHEYRIVDTIAAVIDSPLFRN